MNFKNIFNKKYYLNLLLIIIIILCCLFLICNSNNLLEGNDATDSFATIDNKLENCNNELVYWSVPTPSINNFTLNASDSINAKEQCRKKCYNAGESCGIFLVNDLGENKYSCDLHSLNDDSMANGDKVKRSCIQKPMKSKKYIFEKNAKTWDEHEAAAKNINGHLVCFRDSDEFNFIFPQAMYHFNRSSFWIGGHRTSTWIKNGQNGPKDSNHWYWADGSNWEGEVTTSHWNRGEPNNWNTRSPPNNFENAIQVYNSGRWNDLHSSDKLPAVYQIVQGEKIIPYGEIKLDKLKYVEQIDNEEQYLLYGPYDCGGYDLDYPYLVTYGSLDDCKKNCSNYPDCKGISYNSGSKRCAPKGYISHDQCTHSNNGYVYYEKKDIIIKDFDY